MLNVRYSGYQIVPIDKDLIWTQYPLNTVGIWNREYLSVSLINIAPGLYDMSEVLKYKERARIGGGTMPSNPADWQVIGQHDATVTIKWNK